MSGKDKVESLIAVIVIGTFCALVFIGKIEAAGLSAICMYVVKKFFDGVQNGGNK